MMKKSRILIILLIFILLGTLNVFATELSQNMESTNSTTDNVSDTSTNTSATELQTSSSVSNSSTNQSENSTSQSTDTQTTTSSSSAKTTSGSTKVTGISALSSLPEANLGLNNILSILLIAIGFLLILFAIAILIRLKR
jgi:cytoskeletal protein RodZ